MSRLPGRAWQEAESGREQNELSHGCIASAKAISALPPASDGKGA